ncbi:MAG TPA: hypothetical protein VK116_15705, partial [Planctomycetota bacterium]|nr:hypothetical protein [Planctomycetota bacterium]
MREVFQTMGEARWRLWEAELEGRYRLLRNVGRGGEGTVFLAEDLRRESAPVALKIVDWSRPLGDPARLSAEFLTLLSLAHPAIACVRDFGHATGGTGAWYAADWVSGRDLWS